MTKPVIDHLLNRKVLAAIYGVSVPTIDRWASAGKLPKAVKLAHTTRWRTSDIQRHIAGGGEVQRVRPTYTGAK